jgi:hypothetical protein
MPVKDPHTRTKPLPLANGHGRYITDSPDRTFVSVGEWPLHIVVINISPPNSSPTPGVFYTYFYNHARRLRLEKILYLEPSRSSNGYFNHS